MKTPVDKEIIIDTPRRGCRPLVVNYYTSGGDQERAMLVRITPGRTFSPPPQASKIWSLRSLHYYRDCAFVSMSNTDDDAADMYKVAGKREGKPSRKLRMDAAESKLQLNFPRTPAKHYMVAHKE